MSELSYLEKLLDGVEVEWLPLGHIAAIKTGQSVNKNMISKNPGVYPVINSGREPLGFINTWNTDNDPIGITTRGAGVGSVIWQEGKYFRGNLNYSITIDKKNHINIRYMYHALLHMKNDIHELCTFDGIPALNAGSLKKLLIPIPCPDNPEKSLAIQSEIVRILDKFTALTAELTAELNMRKKQYNYYLDQSLSFKEGEVELKTLGEMGTLIRGKRFVKSDIIPKGVPCIHYGEMYTHYRIWADKAKSYISVELASKLRKASCGDVVFVSAGETIADIGRGTAWLGDEDVVIHDACFFYKSSLNPKYVAYFSRTNFFHDQIKKSISSGKISAINAKGFEKVIIPVPSPEEQARIVAFLDKFDTLTNSITEGLPREIELRQKQYEYYRDLLFSFPKPETVSN
ncbi:TPA: restriction endonuclease subunit S [Escherichia coli]|uniref:restriction endonuclease subunit S n=1 Tax=Escherichia coli TaxID=562 RepID=UPI0019A481E2|nr:restriction endonuclease subunit S [Escherichia coli]EFO2957834.1 restriction endonuclease subunit S [Escherichia coli]MCW1119096.1 restriction endonuclease subunit S [Escherichia coli]HDD1136531.1 restriction endonuclease subunit S [Escherichia coli]HDW3629357.1 restriction endonuclease subunit S [Escherichia coli]HEC4459116.1 restriction endonuclease subunit S [Escherichia coli]